MHEHVKFWGVAVLGRYGRRHNRVGRAGELNCEHVLEPNSHPNDAGGRTIMITVHKNTGPLIVTITILTLIALFEPA